MANASTTTTTEGTVATEKSDRELLLECIAALTANLSAAQIPNAADIRATKMEKLYGFFIKHTKLKDYKPYDSIDVKQWLQQFDATIDQIASAGCGIDLSVNPLSAIEFIRLLKAKISYQVEAEILQSLRANGKDWASATIVEVRTAMQQLYMKSEPSVCSVLKLFSRDRVQKGTLSVSAYYAKWKENLPASLVCTTEDEKSIF